MPLQKQKIGMSETDIGVELRAIGDRGPREVDETNSVFSEICPVSRRLFCDVSGLRIYSGVTLIFGAWKVAALSLLTTPGNSHKDS